MLLSVRPCRASSPEELAASEGVAHGNSEFARALPGIVSRSGYARRSFSRDMLCNKTDPDAELPLEISLPCWKAHHGLCVTKHRRLYKESLSVGNSLIKHFTKEKTGYFYRFFNGSISLDDLVLRKGDAGEGG